MTWTEFCCAIVDQAAIQSVPVSCSCGRAAESAAIAHEKWWTELAAGWRCPGCEAEPHVNAELASIGPLMTAEEAAQIEACREDEIDEAAALRAHLERVLRILDTGEYRRAEDQAAIVAARELVATTRTL